MNNGALARGPEGDTEGITEQRVNTWFTNRRKGLGTPITPPPSKGACLYMLKLASYSLMYNHAKHFVASYVWLWIHKNAQQTMHVRVLLILGTYMYNYIVNNYWL